MYLLLLTTLHIAVEQASSVGTLLEAPHGRWPRSKENYPVTSTRAEASSHGKPAHVPNGCLKITARFGPRTRIQVHFSILIGRRKEIVEKFTCGFHKFGDEQTGSLR